MSPLSRRGFLATGVAGLAGLAAPAIGRINASLLPASSARRVVVIGGGWAGLTAASALRQLAPGLEVVLLEKNAAFWSHPQSNKWLIDLVDEQKLRYDYQKAAKSKGYTFIRDEVIAIERDTRQVVTANGQLTYDWLVLASGIRYDYAPWFGDDARAIAHTRQHFPAAFNEAAETQALKRTLHGFTGGDLLMTIPPMPYRCQPAPFERACMIGWWLKTRRIKGKLTILDPNPITLGFDRVFRQHYAEQIVYVPQATLKAVDPFRKTVVTDFDTFHFDEAILMPPQQANQLALQANLIGRDAKGKPTGWAAQDPLRLHARDDERIFLIGDLIDKVSPLFGYYPKSGHLANRLGRIAAAEIAARAQGKETPTQLPDSVCYVHANVDPMEMIRIDAQYRLRGDGLIQQTFKQNFDPNPQAEDARWAESMYAEFLGKALGEPLSDSQR